MRYDEIVVAIRCPTCDGTGRTLPHAKCETCGGNGIDPKLVDEAGGWDNYAITVHDRPGLFLVVPLS